MFLDWHKSCSKNSREIHINTSLIIVKGLFLCKSNWIGVDFPLERMCYNLFMPGKKTTTQKAGSMPASRPFPKKAAPKSSPAKPIPARGSPDKGSRGPVSSPLKRSPARTNPPVSLRLPLSRSPKRNRPILTNISPERKIDLVGIILALLGVLTFLSLLSANRSSVTGWWVDGLSHLFGWGVFILPLAFLSVGLWLIFRNIERLPLISVERLVGVLLLYLNLLAWLHLLAGGDPALAASGKGGGAIGGIIFQVLANTLGTAGAAVVIAAWLLISLAFTLDVTIPEIFRWIAPIKEALVNKWNAYLAERSARAATASNRSENGSPVLPSSYTPMINSSQANGGFSQSQPVSAAGTVPGGLTTQAGASGTFQAAGAQPAIPAPEWVLPQTDAILETGIQAVVDSDLETQKGHLIEETLASFGAPAHVVEIHRGPTITQYGVEPDFVETRNGHTRVRVSKIVSLADDLALALAAPRIRIQAPVPGRAYVGIEVPNNEISRVALRDVLESEVFQKIRSPIRFALGKDVAGKPVAADLSAMPHLLIAGTTGSGKSVCVNTILSCFLMNNTPDNLRLILVDPKRVELTGYNGIPHLLAPVVVDAEKVVGALQWMMREMDNRYQKFAQAGARNIVDYNNRLQAKGEKPIPYLVIVIDELADLMMLAPDETERTITRLAQLARATGLHLIIATQRPSVDVLTGLIKANFPARIAFAVASGVDSRVILDQPGAERLLGRGDMLFQAPDAPAPVRLQGAYVSEIEIQRLVEYWRLYLSPTTASPADSGVYSPQLDSTGALPMKQAALWEGMAPAEEGDPLYKEAVELIRREGRASISMLQRRMRIGYTRAARLIDTMEEKGIVSPPQANTQLREVLDFGETAPPKED